MGLNCYLVYLQDDKGDIGDKNDSFSDAMMVEMEASVYGLQVCC